MSFVDPSDSTTTPDASSISQVREHMHRQMLSAVSHDLKTPLATIIGSLEIHTRMADKLTKEKRDALINSALIEAYRLDGFISNILDMAKLEGGAIKAKFEPSDIESIINDSLMRLGPKRSKGNINITCKGERRLYNLDPNLVSRALILLIDNALKHAGKTPKIEISYGTDHSGLYIRVGDDGPGIAEGREEEIFSKYTRFSRTDQGNAGTGLGLAICRAIMNIVSGDVRARNKEAGGAEFTLSLGQQA